jgi:DNA polymerase-3 subunit alpha
MHRASVSSSAPSSALRGVRDPDSVPGPAADYPAADPWSFMQTLRREKASLGFYVSGHPLDRFGDDLSRTLRGLVPTSALGSMDPLARVCVAGMVEDYDEKIFREGGRRASFMLEDQVGRVLVRVSGRMVEPFSVTLASATEPVVVYGKVVFPVVAQEEGTQAAYGGGEEVPVQEEPHLMMDDVVMLTEAIRQETRHVAVRVHEKHCGRDQLVELERILRFYPGHASVRLILVLDDGTEAVLALPKERSVEASPGFVDALEKLFGRGSRAAFGR